MTLARRLLLGALLVVTLLVAAIAIIAGERLRGRLEHDVYAELARAARLTGTAWTSRTGADALARSADLATGYRITLLDSSGRVVGDSTAVERPEPGPHALGGDLDVARLHGIGMSRGPSESGDGEELHVAITHPLGFVRVSQSTQPLDEVIGGAQRDVLVSGLVALVGVLGLVVLFARKVSQPIVELRDVARAIASGDLNRRPALAAPAEVGDLATALHRMAEQLASRWDALEADDLLMVAVLESLEEGVLALDERGTVIRINERARQLLHVATPTPFAMEMLPRDAVVRAAVEGALSGVPTSPREMTLFERTVTVSARPLQTAGAVLTLLDLTMLRRLETIRRDFVANVSHELKTPLTAVIGFAETLLDEGIPAEQRYRFAETIRDNAHRMQRIVDDLLDLSRIESGGWRPRMSTVDVGGVVTDVFTSFAAAAAARGLQLTRAIPSDASLVHADATAFRQVVTNLVENAVRYTHAGQVSLEARRDAEGVWIDVRDTGVGIAAEHLPRIFERFYRVDMARSREQGGTGLGLSIVRHLVEAHGGRIEASSVVGRGTTISVLFPHEDQSARHRAFVTEL